MQRSPRKKRLKASPAKKRARRSSGRSSDSDDGGGASSSAAAAAAAASNAALGDAAMQLTKPRFRSGAIKRIRLHNFLTYKDAEVLPGPALNLIIGPNGAGKSSVVSAILVCLGGTLKSLVRADNLREFVKHDEQDAWVELLLHQAHKNGRDLVLRREFSTRTGSQSKFKIDGRVVSKERVLQLRSRLKMLVDNLCVFLAQEKVASFAQLKPKELLREVEKAVDPELAKKHDMLTQERSVEVNMEREENEIKKQLEGAQEKLTSASRAKQRYEQYNRAVERKGVLAKRLLHLELAEHERKLGDARQVRDEIKARLEAIGVDNAPLKEAEQAARDEIDKHKIRVRDVAGNLKVAKADMKAHQKKINNIVIQYEELCEKLNTAAENEKERKKMLRKAKQKEQEYIDRLAGLPNRADLTEDQVSIKQELKSFREDRKGVRKQIQEVEHRMADNKHQLMTVQQRLRRLKDHKEQRERRFKDRDHRAYSKMQRIRQMEQEGKFRGEVLGPLCLELQVADKLSAHMLESMLNYNSLTSYVVENREDWLLLSREKVMVTEVRNARPVQHMSFDPKQPGLRAFECCWADELVAGSDPRWIEFLDSSMQLSKALIMKKPPSNADHVIDSIMPARHNDHGKPCRVLTPDQVVNRQFSRFGRREPFDQIGSLGRPKNFLQTGSGDEAQEEIRQLEANELALKRDNADQEERKKTILQSAAPLEESIKQSMDRLQEIKKQIQEIGAIERKLAWVRERVEEYSAEAQLDELERKIEREKQGKAAEMGKETKALVDASRRMIKAEEEADVLLLYMKHAEAKIVALQHVQRQREASQREIKRELDQAQHRLNEIKRETRQFRNRVQREAPHEQWEPKFEALREALAEDAKAEARRLREAAADAGNAVDPAQEDAAAEAARRRVDNLGEVRRMLARAEAHLLENARENASVLDHYVDAQNKVAEFEALLAAKRQERESRARQLSEAKDGFESELDELVTKIDESFASYFAALGLRSAVRLSKPNGNDYENWALEIRVSFRKTDKDLQLVSATSQSGGERSVATMLFLLCLQHVTQTPFRVVDEINQGMDANNERMIFQNIVRSAANQKQPCQYFLLTPKLLPNLDYDGPIDVHFVHNGAQMVTQEAWDALPFVKGAKEAEQEQDQE